VERFGHRAGEASKLGTTHSVTKVFSRGNKLPVAVAGVRRVAFDSGWADAGQKRPNTSRGNELNGTTMPPPRSSHMKIGILGSGTVAQTIGSKLASLGHDVMLGSRTSDNEKAAAWIAKVGGRAIQGTFADTARHGELLFNCTAGSASLKALELASAEHLAGKVLIDVANPLDFSSGFPPRLSVSNDDSLGEQIQRVFPEALVVKTLNTVTCDVMVNPAMLGTGHVMFVCGNDGDAKGKVTEILKGWLGWTRVIDLGDITMARGTEGYLPLWIRLFGALGTPNFNVSIVTERDV
jgi:hypothetical protein